MIKKFIAKLIGWREQRENFAAQRFQSEQKEEGKLARERQEQIMASRSRKYVSETTVPAGEIIRPNDSVVEKANE